MNSSRWLGLSIFLLATVCLIGTSKYASEAFGQGADDKKIEVQATPDKGSIEPGKSQAVDLTFKRGKIADKDIALTAEVDPKDKGVTVKMDAKVLGKDKAAKLTVESTSVAPEGVYKITVKAKSTDSPDALATIVVTLKKAEVVKEKPPVEKVQPKDKDKPDTIEFTAFTDKDKKTFFQEQVTTTEQKIKVTNQEVIQKQSQTFIIQWTPLGQEKDGNYKVEQKIVGVKMEIDIGGNKISYDSNPTTPNPKNPMTEFFTKLTESKLYFYINIGKDGFKVMKVEGRKEFIDGLSEINPQMKALLNAILSDKALTGMAEPSWWAFPASGTLAKDQKWEKDSKLDLGPIGTYETKFNFVYEGQEGKDKDKIKITTSLKYSPPAASEKAGLPFIIQDAKLASEKGEGYAIFDRANGRFHKTEINMTLKGTLKIEVGNQTTDVTLEQTQKAVSTTHADNPWAAKKDKK